MSTTNVSMNRNIHYINNKNAQYFDIFVHFLIIYIFSNLFILCFFAKTKKDRGVTLSKYEINDGFLSEARIILSYYIVEFCRILSNSAKLLCIFYQNKKEQGLSFSLLYITSICTALPILGALTEPLVHFVLV